MANRQSKIANRPAVALLTGGSDRPYVFGLTQALASAGIALDLIGSDDLDMPELRRVPGVNFLRLRGDQRPEASLPSKALRISKYYAKLIRYAATARPEIFHILWGNRFEFADRTLLMLYYRLLGKKIVLTAHNVNAAKRDSKDSFLNRLTLRIEYRLSHHIFVHTEKMKRELMEAFGVEASKATVIPFGINNFAPHTRLRPAEARRRLTLDEAEKVILFFGRITPYKGLEYLIAAFRKIVKRGSGYRLIIAGRPVRCEAYWERIRETVREEVESGRVLLRAEYVPEEETEIYFKAADVLILPYKDIYQSGILFLGQSFGLPVIASDVGSLKDDIIEGATGFVFRPEDPEALANTIERYFASDLYRNLDQRRQEIRDRARKRHSWDVIGEITLNVYAGLAQKPAHTPEAEGESEAPRKLSSVAQREDA